MNKRRLSLVIIILLLVPWVFNSNLEKVNASIITYGNYEFDEDTKTITKYNGSESNIVIPEKINNISVEGIGKSAFRNCTSIIEVTMPKDIISIGNYAFDGCSSLQQVVMPSNIKKIGGFSFRNCSNLLSVNLEEGLQEIGRSAFENCKTLKKIIVPGSVSLIGDYAFSGCTATENVEINNGVNTIGAYAFYGCFNLLEVWIPSSVTTVGDYSFKHCSNLTKAIMGDGIKTIGKYAFAECAIEDINIPNTVASIGEHAFINCSPTEKIWVNKSVQIALEAFGYWDKPGNIYITGSPTEDEMKLVKKSFESYSDYEKINFTGVLCKEDIDNNNVVEIADLANLGANYNAIKGHDDRYKSEMDMNGDGVIDIYDLVRVANKI